MGTAALKRPGAVRAGLAVAASGFSILVAAVAAPAVGASVGGPGAPPAPGFHIERFADGQMFENSCSEDVAPRFASCLAFVRVEPGSRGTEPSLIRPAVASPDVLGNAGAYDPSWLQSAYNLPSSTGGNGVTVAVVDAYDDPDAESDLAAYRSFWGLPACTPTNGCFREVNQTGGSTPPSPDAGWAQEISLDLDMVSAICPNCHLLLVEANSAAISDLGTAVNEAVSLGADAVDNSYGGPEYSGELADAAAYYDHPGVALTAAAGDGGYQVDVPAADPDVTAVGGTTLDQSTNGGTRDATETAWSMTGSGCSAYVSKPSWQTDSGCSTRTVADVAADADPSTPVWVYDSYANSGSPWLAFGGTSASSAIIAGVYGLAGAPAAGAAPNSYPYSDLPDLNDIVSGSDGSCGSYLCNAGPGYDGPTGLGTPNGVGAFIAPADKLSQSISFSAPATGAVGGSAPLVPTASSGLTVSLSVDASTSNDACSLSGDTVDYLNVGSCVLDANEGGNASYRPATQVKQTIAVQSTPGAPTGASAVAGNGQATVSFDPPSSNGGSAIISYTVTSSPGGLTGSGASSPIVVSGLGNGTSYTFTVTATNTRGTGPASSPSAAVTPTGPPAAPTAVSAVPGNGQATVAFSAPASNGGSAISSYRVTASPGGATATTTASPIAVTGLSNGQSYTFTVTATNGVGTGPASAPSSAVVPESNLSPSPVVSGLSPSQGTSGGSTVVTISGSGFATASGATTVSVGGNAASAVACSSTTSCTATTPAGSGTVEVRATVGGQVSNPNPPADQFTYVSSGGGGGGGGGGGAPSGGGGGSDAIGVAMTPATQSVASGGTATFTVVVTNEGGSYLFNVGASDPAAPGCNQATANTPAATLAILETMAPGVSVTYSCTLTVSGSVTNTLTAQGTGPDAATVTATASAQVSAGAASAPITPPTVAPKPASRSSTPPPVTLSISGLSSIHLNARKPTLRFHVKVSGSKVLTIVLLDSKSRTLAHWTVRLKSGSAELSILIPSKDRHPGHDKLRISAGGKSKPKTLALALIA